MNQLVGHEAILIGTVGGDGLMVQLLSFLKRCENLIFENVKTYNLLLLQSYFERILNLRFVGHLDSCLLLKKKTLKLNAFKPSRAHVYQKGN